MGDIRSQLSLGQPALHQEGFKHYLCNTLTHTFLPRHSVPDLLLIFNSAIVCCECIVSISHTRPKSAQHPHCTLCTCVNAKPNPPAVSEGVQIGSDQTFAKRCHCVLSEETHLKPELLLPQKSSLIGSQTFTPQTLGSKKSYLICC